MVLLRDSQVRGVFGFERPGYAFVGWNTKADGSGTSYDDKAEVSDLADPGKTAVLYAQWKKDADPTPDPDPDPEPERRRRPLQHPWTRARRSLRKLR